MSGYVESGYVQDGYFVTSDLEPIAKPVRGGARFLPSFPDDVVIVGETYNRRLKSKREEILFISKP